MKIRWNVVGAIVALLLGPTAVEASPPTAHDLLQQIRQAYAELPAYRDLGEIERTVVGGEPTAIQFFETTRTADGALSWRTHAESASGFEERVIWSRGGNAFVYSSLLRQYKPVSSMISELVHGFGEGGFEALVVPLLLAGSTDVLREPEGAAVEGPETCGQSTCWVLSLSFMGATIESELWVDEKTSLIRQVVARLARGPVGQTTIEVRHHPDAAAPVAYEPPAGARQVAEWEAADAAADTVDEDPWVDFAFQEEITVALFSVAARIVDARGNPLPDLQPEDLIVTVGKEVVPVFSLAWSSSYQEPIEIPSVELAAAEEARELATPLPAPARGQLIVLFLQVDLEPSRIKGHLKLLPEVDALVRALHPADRVAIVSFDSHLKLWQDFTRDRAATFASLRRAISFGSPLARRNRGRLLAEHFDFRAAANAANPEKALQLTAEALAHLPGAKQLIYLGWGLGRYGAGGVRMTADYEPAVRALDAADTTVFVLDVSQADYHSLEVGLKNVAHHTGGTYASTYHFTSQAVDRLARTISGSYTVTIDRTSLPEARGRLQIALRNKKGRVLFKPLILG